MVASTSARRRRPSRSSNCTRNAVRDSKVVCVCVQGVCVQAQKGGDLNNRIRNQFNVQKAAIAGWVKTCIRAHHRVESVQRA